MTTRRVVVLIFWVGGFDGGARGVDSWVVEAAEERGLRTIVFPADWERHGRRAGPLRNAEIVAHADRLVAFWNGRSRGTLNTVLAARAAGLPISIFDAAGAPVAVEAALAAAVSLGVTAAWTKARGHR
jgi:hypothetical protein